MVTNQEDMLPSCLAQDAVLVQEQKLKRAQAIRAVPES